MSILKIPSDSLAALWSFARFPSHLRALPSINKGLANDIDIQYHIL
jgi:hypothetical protein